MIFGKVVFIVMLTLPGLSEPYIQEGPMSSLEECTEAVESFMQDFQYHELEGKVLAGCRVEFPLKREAE